MCSTKFVTNGNLQHLNSRLTNNKCIFYTDGFDLYIFSKVKLLLRSDNIYIYIYLLTIKKGKRKIKVNEHNVVF